MYQPSKEKKSIHLEYSFSKNLFAFPKVTDVRFTQRSFQLKC